LATWAVPGNNRIDELAHDNIQRIGAASAKRSGDRPERCGRAIGPYGPNRVWKKKKVKPLKTADGIPERKEI
jgi:hypothetical protein